MPGVSRGEGLFMRGWLWGVWLCLLSTQYSVLSTQYAYGQDARTKRKPAITALALTPDGAGYLQGSQAGVFFQAFAGTPPERFATQLEHVHALAFSPDGKTVAMAGGTPGEAGSVELWSWPGRKRLTQLGEHDDLVYDVVWLANGKAVATAGADRVIHIWDIGTSKCTATLAGHSGPVLALAISPDGALLCSGSADQTIRVWDTGTGKLLRALNNHLGPVHGLAFRPSTKDEPLTLASAGGDSTVRLWQPAIGRMVRILRHPAPVHVVAWGHDGAHLFSGAKDGRVRQFDATSDKVLLEQELTRGCLLSLTMGQKPEQFLAGDSLGRILPISRQP